MKSIGEQSRNKSICFDEEIFYDIELSELDIRLLLTIFQDAGKEIDEDKLKEFKLVKAEKGKVYPTNALMIILGKFDNCTVKCSRIRGVNNNLILAEEEYSGNIFSVLVKSMSFIQNFIHLRAEFEGLYRNDIYEIPLGIIADSLIYALVYRDYSMPESKIEIVIYDDVISLVSPGCLTDEIVSFKQLKNGDFVRNKIISNVIEELVCNIFMGEDFYDKINLFSDNIIDIPKLKVHENSFGIEINRPKIE